MSDKLKKAPSLAAPSAEGNVFAETKTVALGATGGMPIPEAERIAKPMADFCDELAAIPIEKEEEITAT